MTESQRPIGVGAADSLRPVQSRDPSGNRAPRSSDGISAPAGNNLPSVDAALRWGEQRLEAEGIQGARLEATLLLGHVLSLSRAQVLASLSDALTNTQQADFRALIERRAAREPLQYLRGRAPFLDFEVEIEPGVFIPRPETEQVVERALELWDPQQGRWAVDVGTGSGAIAIGLALGTPAGRVLAIDRSAAALAMARRNAELLGVAGRVRFVRADLLSAIRPRVASAKPQSAHPTDGGDATGAASPEKTAAAIGVVVSNPPYVPDDAEVDLEVRHNEPRDAWAAGATGMEVYERVIPRAAELLLPGRCLVLELGYEMDAPVHELLALDGRWNAPAIEDDYQGIPRTLAVERARD